MFSIALFLDRFAARRGRMFMPVRRGLSVVAAVAVACGLAGTVASPASAGTYRVIMCEAPDGSAVPTDGITLMYSGYVWLGDECTTGNKRVVLRFREGSYVPPGAMSEPSPVPGSIHYAHAGAQGVARATAPANTRFVAASVTRSFTVNPGVSADRAGTPTTAMFQGAIETNGVR